MGTMMPDEPINPDTEDDAHVIERDVRAARRRYAETEAAVLLDAEPDEDE